MPFFSPFRRKKRKSFIETVAEMLDQNTSAEISQYIKKEMQRLRMPPFAHAEISLKHGPIDPYEYEHLKMILLLIERKADDCLVQDILREYGLQAFEFVKEPIQEYIHRQIKNNIDVINLFDNTKIMKDEVTHRDLIINYPKHFPWPNLYFPNSESYPEDDTLLHHAVLYDRPELVQALIHAGANVNRLNRRDESPLHVAARIGSRKIINMLVDAGAGENIFKRNIEEKTPIYIAGLCGNTEAVDALLTHGADPNSRQGNGAPLLCYMAQLGHLEIVKKLLRAGANTTLTHLELPPLGYAIEYEQDEVFRVLLKLADRESIERKRSNVLEVVRPWMEEEHLHYIAVKRGRVDMLKMLLDSNIAVSQDVLKIILLKSVQFTHYKMVKLLLDYNIKMSEELIETLFIYAVRLRVIDSRDHTEIFIAFCNKYPHITKNSAFMGLLLRRPVISGNLAMFKAILHHSPDVDSRNSDGQTSLYLAAKYGRLDMVKALLAKGADRTIADTERVKPQDVATYWGRQLIAQVLSNASANIHNKNNMTHHVQDPTAVKQSATINPSVFFDEPPLHVAALNGHLDEVNVLLAKGADKDSINSQGETPLYLAATYGHLGVVKALLQNSADKDSRNSDGETPLYIAAKYGHLGVVNALLQNGANKDSRNNDGEMPLYVAAKYDHTGVVNALLQNGADKNSINSHGEALLHIAARYGNTGVVNALLDKGVNKDSRNSCGETPLYLAAKYGHLPVFKTLLQNGADKTITSNNGATPERLAMEHDDRMILRALYNPPEIIHKTNNMTHQAQDQTAVKQSTTINPSVFFDNRALHVAALNGHVDQVKDLLAKGADKDSRNARGQTPLYIAAKKGHLGVVNALLAEGADSTIADSDGVTPQGVATLCGKQLIAQVLSNASANIHNKNNMTHHVQDPTAVKQSDTTNPSVFFDNRTLHVAALNGDVDEVKALLAEGADKDSRNSDGETPLYIAAKYGHLGVVNALLAEGADKTIAANDGATPQRVATYSEAPYRAKNEIIRVLFNAPANIDETITMTRIESPPYIYRKAPL